MCNDQHFDIGQVGFWTDRWNRLNGASTAFGGYSSANVWNAMAEGYGKERHGHDVDERMELTLSRLTDAGFSFDGSRILDVGCGPGRYAREFARRGAEVVCIDISENMIGRLERECTPGERARITPLLADWKSLSLAQHRLTLAFDLVFANMTPAVTGPEAFMKLMQASKKWCWFRGWAGPRSNPLLERMHETISGGAGQPFTGNFSIAWNLACAAGYFPDCAFEQVRWTQRKSMDESIGFHTAFFRREGNTLPDDELEQRVQTVLHSVAVDGYIENTVTGHTGSMLWSVAG